MDTGHEAEFRRLFEAEATEQLDRLADTVLELERAGPRPELVATLFRDAHTLKSSAALVGLHAVGRIAHRLEDLLGELRAGTRAVTPGLADGVLDVVDALRAMVAAGLTGQPGDAHEAAAEAGLRRAAEAPGGSGPEGPGGSPAGGPGAVAAAEVPLAEDATFRQLFAAEVVPELERLTQTALDVERRGAEPELVAALFRGAHSLKGSAAVVGFTEVAELAHGLEDRLDELRSGRRTATPGFVDAVLAVLDAVRAATPVLVAGEDPAAALAPGRAALATLAAPAAEPPAVEEPAATGEATADAEPVAEVEAPVLAPGLVRPPLLRAAAPIAAPRVPPPAPAPEPAPEPVGAPEPEAVAAPVAVPEPVAAPEPEPPPEPVREPVAESAPAPATAPAPEPAAASAPGDRLVPVGLDRLDGLVRVSGEAVAAQLRLTHLLREHIAGDPDAEAAALELRRALSGVQEQTMRTRMTTLEGIAGNLRRAVRDVARASGKEVDYALAGERVELDRAVLDGLRDPLLHLVRNAVDHGLEPPDEREAAGKPRSGTVRVTAERRGPEIVVTVADDGAGLDLDALRAAAGEPALPAREAASLVFRPGLSTAGAVTDISGRGVGLDAVREAVEHLRGRVAVTSEPGAGCRFEVTVPLTLAVVACVMLEAGGARYHLPTHATVVVQGDPRAAQIALEGGAALWVGGDVVPLTDLGAALGTGGPEPTGPAVVLQGSGGSRHAFRVDAVLGQRDVTVKELGAVVPRSQLVAGASIEADGEVVLVLDPTALVEAASGRRRGAAAEAAPPTGAAHPPAAGAPPPPEPAPPAAARVLVVDDALTVRELERSILERAGYAVRVAVDGQDALARLAEERPDLVVTDVEMPRLDGYGLVAAIRARPGLESVPVLMVTSRASPEDRRRGLDAGADGYLVKQDFDAQRLLDAVARLLGS